MGLNFRQNWSQATPYLAFCVFTFACGDLVFGIDTSMFGSLQALPSWLNTFGTRQPDGKLALTTYQKAIANSVVFIGRLLGCTTFEPVVEFIGFKKMLMGIGCLQIIAVVIELVAKDWVVFTVGRVIAYLAVGYIENTGKSRFDTCGRPLIPVVPTYSAEIAPSALRGFCAGLLTPVITMSSVWGAGMCQAFATETTKKGWMIPVGVQAIPAVMILVLAPFTTESPRWLITHNRKEQALKALRKLRPKDAVSSGVCEAEIDALHSAIQQDKELNNARWRDIFRGTYFRRALICSALFFLYQTTGNSFYNAYGPTFFVSVGLGSKSFTYATVVQLVGAIGSLMAIFLTDYVGRRPLIITGATLLVVFNCLIAGFGTKLPHTDTANNVVVASFVMMLWSTKISWATHCYLVGSELGGTQMRKKIIMVGTTVDLIAAWLVSFTSPYIMNEPYGGIGGNIGYIFGGIAALGLVFAILVVPELKGRALEEVDELFEKPRWGWQYAKVRTSGYGAAITQIERGNVDEAQAQAHKDVLDHPDEMRKDDTVQIEDVRR